MAHYVCSDIHGLKDRYDQMIKTIKAEDTLYILGDVIDRGKDGIAILMDIMQRENVVMLLGNHEYMMKQYYDAQKGSISNHNLKNEVISRWEHNHCEWTRQAFECLNLDKQEEILAYIAHLPVVIADLRIKEQLYYLVHGCPISNIHEGTWNYCDIIEKKRRVEDAIWNRIHPYETYFEDRCVIVGHTPTPYFQSTTPYSVWHNTGSIKQATLIDIDCGCAANHAYTQLALLNLEQREVIYF